MEIVVALTIIFSVMALFAAIYALEELMKLRDRVDIFRIKIECYAERTDRILDLAQSVLNNNDKMIKYIDVLEGCIKKEESTDSEAV